MLAPDSALWLTVFYAALRIGAIVTPVSTLTSPSELSHIVRTSDAQNSDRCEALPSQRLRCKALCSAAGTE